MRSLKSGQGVRENARVCEDVEACEALADVLAKLSLPMAGPDARIEQSSLRVNIQMADVKTAKWVQPAKTMILGRADTDTCNVAERLAHQLACQPVDGLEKAIRVKSMGTSRLLDVTVEFGFQNKSLVVTSVAITTLPAGKTLTLDGKVLRTVCVFPQVKNQRKAA